MQNSFAFCLKLDTDWTHLFWEYARKEKAKKSKQVDPYYMRFWNRYLLNRYIVESDKTQEALENDDLFKKLYGKAGDDSNITYENFDDYARVLSSKNAVKDSQAVLDQLKDMHETIENMSRPAWAVKERFDLFPETINQPQRILFYAVGVFLEKNIFSELPFKRWMRVVWNLSADPDIRSVPAMIGAMRMVADLAEGSGDIYSFLQKKPVRDLIAKDQTALQRQLWEERKKAKLILADPAWESRLIEAESHPLFMGSIRFLIEDEPDISQFEKRLNNAKGLFSKDGAKTEFWKDHILMRSVISRMTEWNDLMNLNMKDDFDNWQLHLRRKRKIQEYIRDVTDSENKNKMLQEMNRRISTKSSISGYGRGNENIIICRFIHEQLYRDKASHSWMQENEVIRLQWSHEFICAHKPRSWYHWVILNTYRNELIAKLIKQNGLDTKQRCGKSNIFWEILVRLNKEINGITVNLEVLRDLQIDVFVNDKDAETLRKKKVPVSLKKAEGKYLYKQYKYPQKIRKNQVNAVADLIRDEIFTTEKKTSLVGMITRYIK